MKKQVLPLSSLLLALFLSGCSSTAGKSGSISIIYLVAALLSVVLLVGYCTLIKEKDFWFLLLFSSVLVVNIGYWILSVSKTIGWALFANRISYLGSVFLPFSMLMSIFRLTGAKQKKWLPWVLFAVAVLVFLIAATPGYWDVYYRCVSIRFVNGATVLEKEYGPLHILYLFYLLGYLSAMIAAIIYAMIKKRLGSPLRTMILLVAVFINIGVWLLEKLIYIDFELLAISYIFSELSLLGLHLLIQENQRLLLLARQNVAQDRSEPAQEAAECPACFTEGLLRLTQAEQRIYQLYLSGKTSRQILEELNITENTLKYHNRNIYGKLGVTSRKQMLEYAKTSEKAQ